VEQINQLSEQDTKLLKELEDAKKFQKKEMDVNDGVKKYQDNVINWTDYEIRKKSN